MNLSIGQIIEAEITASDSFYKRVIGKVVRVKPNGFVQIQATMAINKWSESWKESMCGMSVKAENIIRQ